MNKNQRQKFTYTSVGDKPKTSKRDAFVFQVPGDSFYGYELSEFDEDEAIMYAEVLEDIFQAAEDMVSEAIEELGLKHNFRRFKQEGVAE